MAAPQCCYFSVVKQSRLCAFLMVMREDSQIVYGELHQRHSSGIGWTCFKIKNISGILCPDFLYLLKRERGKLVVI